MAEGRLSENPLLTGGGPGSSKRSDGVRKAAALFDTTSLWAIGMLRRYAVRAGVLLFVCVWLVRKSGQLMLRLRVPRSRRRSVSQSVQWTVTEVGSSPGSLAYTVTVARAAGHTPCQSFKSCEHADHHLTTTAAPSKYRQ